MAGTETNRDVKGTLRAIDINYYLSRSVVNVKVTRELGSRRADESIIISNVLIAASVYVQHPFSSSSFDNCSYNVALR